MNGTNTFVRDAKCAEREDETLLWKPVVPLATDFRSTLSVYRNGSEEVRHLLAVDCNLIFECSMCRNLFRSLTCFFTHKRLFCRGSPSEKPGTSAASARSKEAKLQEAASHDCNGNTSKLEQKTESESLMQAVVKQEDTAVNQPKTELQSKELLEKENVKVPDKQQPVVKASAVDVPPATAPAAKQECKCPTCPMVFNSFKALKIHNFKKHTNPKRLDTSTRKTLPDSNKFARNAPNKTVNDGCAEEVRIKTEEAIASHAIKEESPSESLSDNNSTSNEFVCSYCKKKFQRKSTWHSHVSTCRLKEVNLPSEETAAKSATQPKPSAASNDSVNIKNEPDEQQDPEKPPTRLSSDTSPVLIDKKAKKAAKKLKQKSDEPCICDICNKTFNALSNLRRHKSMFHHRTRKYGCSLCSYRAFRMYDVHNHLNYVHKIKEDSDRLCLEYAIKLGDQSSVSEESVTAMPVTPTNVPALKQKKIYAERRKLKRSNQTSPEDDLSDASSTKRPKRHCTKPVNKDFVYDMPNYMKKELGSTASELEKSTRKSVSLTNLSSLGSTVLESKIKTETRQLRRPKLWRALTFSMLRSMSGSAQKTAEASIQQGHAACASIPPLPTERPLVGVRNTPIRPRTTVPVIQTTQIEETVRTAEPIDTNAALNLDTASEFRLKPLPTLLARSTLNSLLEKVDPQLNRNKPEHEQKKTTNHNGNRRSSQSANHTIRAVGVTDRNDVRNIARPKSTARAETKLEESLLRLALEN